MAAPANFLKAYLATALAAGTAASSVVLDRVTTLDGQTIETSDFADFTRGVLTVNPEGDGLTSYPENISFTTVTAATKTLSGAIRGLSKAGVTTTSLMRYHPVGTPVILSFGSHQIQDLLDYVDDAVAGANATADQDTAGTAFLTEDLSTLARAMNSIVTQQVSPGMTVRVYPFAIGRYAKATASNTGTITAPTVNPRIDLVVYNIVSADIAVRTGTEAASPAEPSPQNGDIVLASVQLPITAVSIKDVSDGTNGYIKRRYFPSSEAGAVLYLTFGETIADRSAVYLKSTDQKAWKTDADASDSTAPFLGFALETGTVDTIHAVQVGGIIGGMSGLTAGTEYWLSGTAGGLSSTAGTFAYKVGIALTTTILLIDATPKMNPVTRKYVIADSPATWTKPKGLKYIDVEIVGGGGGGGGSTTTQTGSGGGGGGEYARKRIAASALGATETVTIGAAGAAGAASGGAGGTGGTTSFGSHVTAVGGGGGTGGSASASVAGGSGGTGGTGADETITGGIGGVGSGFSSAAGAISIGGAGGDSRFGMGAPTNPTVNAETVAGAATGGYGAGGSGSSQANNAADTAGGAGTAGYVKLTEYF